MASTTYQPETPPPIPFSGAAGSDAPLPIPFEAPPPIPFMPEARRARAKAWADEGRKPLTIGDPAMNIGHVAGVMAKDNSALDNFSAGAARGVLNTSAGAMSLASRLPGPDPASLREGATLARNAAEDYAVQPGAASLAGGAAGGAMLTGPAMLVPGPQIPIAMAAMGGAQGAGNTASETDAMRQAGHQVDPGAEHKAEIANAIIGALSGYLGGKALPQGPSAAVRIGTNVAAGAGIGAGQTAAENAVAQQTIDPQRPLMQGVGESAIAGGAQQGFLSGLHEAANLPKAIEAGREAKAAEIRAGAGEAFDALPAEARAAVAEPGTLPPAIPFAEGKGSEATPPPIKFVDDIHSQDAARLAFESQRKQAEAGPLEVRQTPISEDRYPSSPDTTARPAQTRVQQSDVSGQPETQLNPQSDKSPAQTSARTESSRPSASPVPANDTTGAGAVPMPKVHPDMHPSVLQEAWDIVSAEHPELAKMVKKIAPLDTYNHPTANASWGPESGTLRVSLDKKTTPETLRHEFEHIAQTARGEVKHMEDFASEEQFHAAMEAPAIEKSKSVQGGSPAPTAEAVYRSDKPKPVNTETPAGRLKEFGHGIIDAAKNYSGKMFPTATRLSRESGEAAARYVSSRTYAKVASPIVADHVLGQKFTPEFDKLVGAILTEDNLSSVRKEFADKAAKAKTPDEAARYRAAADNVKSIVNAPGSPLVSYNDANQTGVSISAALKRPDVAAAIERYKQWFAGEPNENYKVAQEIAPDEELPSRGELTGVRVNLIAVKPEEQATGTTIYTSPRGNLRNPLQKPSPFAKAAKGTGHGYDISLSRMIENTLGKGTEGANQMRMYNQLVKDGLATFGAPGDRPTLGGKSTYELDLKRRSLVVDGKTVPLNKVLHVRSDVYPEIRKALNSDALHIPAILGKAADVANAATLASVSEASFHVGNQLAALIHTPGTGVVIPGLIRNAVQLIKNTPEVQGRLMELARMGALKDEHPTGSKLNPMTYTAKAISFTDKAGRLLLDDAFKKLASKGLIENTETNRRDLINQFGMYQRRAQANIIRLARDTKIAPFATAGTNFFSLGLKAVTLSPGARATSMRSSVRLRATVATRYASILAATALANYVAWGKVDGGDPDVPFGAVRISDDKEGNLRYVDPFAFTSLRRGLRAVGLLAMIEGARRGNPVMSSLDKGWKDAASSVASPFVGPVVEAGAIVATGRDPLGFETIAAKKGESQAAAQIKAAATKLNPIVDAAVHPETDWTNQLGKFTVKTVTKDTQLRRILADRQKDRNFK